MLEVHDFILSRIQKENGKRKRFWSVIQNVLAPLHAPGGWVARGDLPAHVRVALRQAQLLRSGHRRSLATSVGSVYRDQMLEGIKLLSNYFGDCHADSLFLSMLRDVFQRPKSTNVRSGVQTM